MSTQAIAQPKTRRLSPFAALLWEEWRQTRRALLLGSVPAFLALLPVLIIDLLDPVHVQESDEFGWVYGVMVLLFCWQAGVLFFSGYGRNDLSLQFPRRLFVLPVHSTALALTRMAYGVAVVATTFGLLGWLAATIRPNLFGPGYTHAFVAVQVLLYMQGIAWFFGRRPGLALAVGLVSWLPFAILAREIFVRVRVFPLSSLLSITILASAPAIVAFTALAVYAVSVQRNGGAVKRFACWRKLERMRTAIAGEPATPERTLFDFEWRRRGRWIPVFGLMSAFLLMLLFSGITPVASFFALLVGCFSGLFAAGLFQIIVSERERVSGLQRFLMTRPASTRNLGLARLWALGAGYSMTFVVLCLMMLGALQVMHLQGGTRTLVLRSFFSPIQFVEDRVDQIHKPSVPAQVLGDKHAPAMTSRSYVDRHGRVAEPETYVHVKYESVSWTLTKVLTAFVFFYLLGWLCLTQPLTTLFLFYVVAVLANSLDGKAGWESDWGYTMFSAIVSAGIIGLTVMHLRRAFRRGLLSRRALYTVLAAWFALAYSAVYLCVRAGGTPREVLGLQSSIVAFTLVLAASALPFWPFATIPLSIHRHRHQ